MLTLLTLTVVAHGQSQLPGLLAEVERLRTAPAEAVRPRQIAPEQLKVDWDYAFSTVNTMAASLQEGASDDSVARAVTALESKKTGIDGYLALLDAVARKGTPEALRGLAQKLPELLQFEPEGNGRLAGQAATLAGELTGPAQVALFGAAVQAAYRSLMAKPDDETLLKSMVEAIEKRGARPADAQLFLSLARTHPKDDRFNYRAGCHLAGLWTGNRGLTELPSFYPESVTRDQYKALTHLNAAGALKDDPVYLLVRELVVAEIALDQMNRFTLSWGEKDRALKPVEDRLAKIPSAGDSPFANWIRTFYLRALQNTPAAMATIQKIPEALRNKALKSALEELKKRAHESALEGVPGGFWRLTPGVASRTVIHRVGVKPPRNLLVWFMVEDDLIDTISFQANVCSRSAEPITSVPMVAVERHPKPKRDAAGNEMAELTTDHPFDPAQVGSVEIVASSETVRPGQ
ncbi:MAG: hypothetical protein HY815_22180 [Candidatus Riflebacteria bacterium]|nr:hypothetical protein [Candidatus Riflebacteria bacterium]